MPYTLFDAHADTISKICDAKASLLENDCHIDIKKMSKNRHIQVFAAFIDKKSDLLPPLERCNQLIDYYRAQLATNSDFICHCNSFEDINNAMSEGKTAAILSIEGGEALGGQLENLTHFYNRGVRLLTLCWNYQNEIADGALAKADNGLTEFGRQVVNEMNALGMVIDISHISEKGFWDTIELSNAPIVASHSNAFAIKKHKRNLSDDQIRAIISQGGCIGINLYTEFLADGRCDITSVLRHIEYILAMGGENNIGIGCDFDGMDSLPIGITGIQDLEKIPDMMLRLGYSESLVSKVTHGNFLRVFNRILK